MRTMICCLCVLCLSGIASGERPTIDDLEQALIASFDEFLEEPLAYRQQVEAECAIFPEGRLFPYVYLGLAYVNLSLAEPDRRLGDERRIRDLIKLCGQEVAAKLQAPGGDLKRLKSYQAYGTDLSHLNLLLGAYRLISEDEAFDHVHTHLTTLLVKALDKTDGRPLRSYPGDTWTVDTLHALLSIRLHDRLHGTQRATPLVRQHLQWLEQDATDKATGLPKPYYHPQRQVAHGPPRGSELSYRLCVMPHLDAEASAALYQRYVDHFWREAELLAGFAEWPDSRRTKADIDSGPIIMGVGLGATGMALGAARANQGTEQLVRLHEQLRNLDIVRPLLSQVAAESPLLPPMQDRYTTGFLFGDVMLLYSLTWRPWLEAQAAERYSYRRIFQQAREDQAWADTTSVRQRLLLVRRHALQQATASDPVSDRYQITCYGGPIDLVHFLMLAAETVADKPLAPRLYQEWKAEGGPQNQHSFNWSQPPEAHPDDLPSNALGALWGWQLQRAEADLETELLQAFARFIAPLVPVPDDVAKQFSHRAIVMGLPPGRASRELTAARYGWFTAAPLVQTERLNAVAREQLGAPLCEDVPDGAAALAKAGFQLKPYKGQPILIVPRQ